jgi:hypothetical protein
VRESVSGARQGESRIAVRSREPPTRYRYPPLAARYRSRYRSGARKPDLPSALPVLRGSRKTATLAEQRPQRRT